ncbi:MAG: HNH endonuclease [Burkholderiaceae bacterium]
MPTKPLDRLMFAQGGLCYFCSAPLPKAEASVEHLVASARGGSNGDDNCVACCKAVNALFGSMSLKEKIKVVLNQKGQFRCPNNLGGETSKAPVPAKVVKGSGDAMQFVIENLKGRGNARPRRLKTLASTIKSLANLKLDDQRVAALITQLQKAGKISIDGEQVSYSL